jgi:drug/metabolite transporter (DMT)-like permease
VSVLLALAASLSWGFADFGAGVAARRIDSILVTGGAQTAGLVLVAVAVAAAGDPVPSAAQLGWAAFAGAAGVTGLAAFYRALAVGTMGIVGPITATASLVPLVYGLARGERPSTIQGVGVGLAVVGVIAASLEHSDGRALRRFGIGVGFALIAAVSFGWSLVGLNRAAAGGTVFAVLAMRIVAVPLVLGAVLLLKPGLPRTPRLWLLMAAVGIADTGATLLYGAASTRGLLSVVAVLASLYPIVILVLARVLLAERIATLQLAGVGVVLAGVALVSAG